MKQRNVTDSQSDMPIHHSNEAKQGYATGSIAKLKPAPTPHIRRRSEGDIRYPFERQGGEGMALPPGMRGQYVPQELIKATIKPMGVPLSADMV